MATENRAMRDRYRRHVWATRLGRAVAMYGWYALASARWIGFSLSTFGVGAGWGESRRVLRPHVGMATFLSGALPSRGSTTRSGVRWGADPASVAAAGADG